VSGAEDGESQGGGGEGSTPFPAQCRFEIVEEFMPLPEAGYYNPNPNPNP